VNSGTNDEIGGDVGALELWICLLIHRQSLVVEVRLLVVAQEERANHGSSGEFLRLQRQVDVHRADEPNQRPVTAAHIRLFVAIPPDLHTTKTSHFFTKT